MKNISLLLIIFLFFYVLSLSPAIGSEDAYFNALEFAQSGEKDLAFINFMSILREVPYSKYRQEALFAATEYYMDAGDYIDAFTTLNEFLKDYPDSKMRPFVLFYLLKISRAWKQEALTRDIEKEIINLKQIVLLFKENQEYSFKSPMGANYKLLYYIDRTEFYLDDKLQAQVFN